jgi:hypothetical protein
VKVAGLPKWREVALILLSMEALLAGAAVGLVLYQSLRGLAQLMQQLRPWLFQARLGIWKVSQKTKQTMRALAAPFVWWHSVVEGLRRALQVLGWR